MLSDFYRLGFLRIGGIEVDWLQVVISPAVFVMSGSNELSTVSILEFIAWGLGDWLFSLSPAVITGFHSLWRYPF